MTNGWLERQTTLIGENATAKLCSSSVMVFGVGGVGGYVVEALARCGIGRLVLVDFDVISESNINRQIIADVTTVGKKKTSVMAERVLRINPNCNVIERDLFVTAENASDIILSENVDYVIDAIDNVSAKLGIIQYCKGAGIPVISSMGTGNKLDVSRFKICDIKKTSVCPLARVIRQELKKRNINRVDVLFSDEQPRVSRSRIPSSISFVPSSAGLMIAGYVVRQLIADA